MGEAFSNQRAKEELKKIASPPANIHVYQVESFAALDAIKDRLKATIFSIEGGECELCKIGSLFKYTYVSVFKLLRSLILTCEAFNAYIHIGFAGSQATGETLKMEMSQIGFSAAFVPSVIKKWNKN